MFPKMMLGRALQSREETETASERHALKKGGNRFRGFGLSGRGGFLRGQQDQAAGNAISIPPRPWSPTPHGDTHTAPAP